MTDEVVHYLLALNTREAYRRDVMPGSVVVMAHCGHRAFVAPTGQAFLATPEGAGAYVICSLCGKEHADATEKRFLPGQQEELTGHLGVAEADQVLAWARDWGVGQPPE